MKGGVKDFSELSPNEKMALVAGSTTALGATIGGGIGFASGKAMPGMGVGALVGLGVGRVVAERYKRGPDQSVGSEPPSGVPREAESSGQGQGQAVGSEPHLGVPREEDWLVKGYREVDVRLAAERLGTSVPQDAHDDTLFLYVPKHLSKEKLHLDYFFASGQHSLDNELTQGLRPREDTPYARVMVRRHLVYELCLALNRRLTLARGAKEKIDQMNTMDQLRKLEENIMAQEEKEKMSERSEMVIMNSTDGKKFLKKQLLARVSVLRDFSTCLSFEDDGLDTFKLLKMTGGRGSVAAEIVREDGDELIVKSPAGYQYHVRGGRVEDNLGYEVGLWRPRLHRDSLITFYAPAQKPDNYIRIPDTAQIYLEVIHTLLLAYFTSTFNVDEILKLEASLENPKPEDERLKEETLLKHEKNEKTLRIFAFLKLNSILRNDGMYSRMYHALTGDVHKKDIKNIKGVQEEVNTYFKQVLSTREDTYVRHQALKANIAEVIPEMFQDMFPEEDLTEVKLQNQSQGLSPEPTLQPESEEERMKKLIKKRNDTLVNVSDFIAVSELTPKAPIDSVREYLVAEKHIKAVNDAFQEFEKLGYEERFSKRKNKSFLLRPMHTWKLFTYFSEMMGAPSYDEETETEMTALSISTQKELELMINAELINDRKSVLMYKSTFPSQQSVVNFAQDMAANLKPS